MTMRDSIGSRTTTSDGPPWRREEAEVGGAAYCGSFWDHFLRGGYVVGVI